MNPSTSQNNDENVKELQTKLEAALNDITILKKQMKEHMHTDTDGSHGLQKNIDLLPLQTLGAGGVATMTGYDSKDLEATTLLLQTGHDSNPADGAFNTQVQLQHQQGTDGDTNDSFMFSFRGPYYEGFTGTVTSAGSSLTQTEFNWNTATSSLVGAYIVAFSSSTAFEVHTITANAADNLTISGTWAFSARNVHYFVFMPTYLGSSQFPWRRFYVGEGTGGGIRIGQGNTNGGQNGLLYMDATGDLYWRNKGGTSTKLN